MWHIIPEQNKNNPPMGVLPAHWRWVVFLDSYTKEFARRFGQAMRFIVLRESIDPAAKYWLRESEWRLGQEVCLAAVTRIPMNMPDALWFNLKERPIGEILFNPEHPANQGLIQRVQMEYSLDPALLKQQALYLRRSVFSLGDYFITIQEAFYPALFRVLEGHEHD